jgi:hypothetical protein
VHRWRLGFALISLATCSLLLASCSGQNDASHGGSVPAKRRSVETKPAIFTGSYGVESRAVIDENERRGTSAWHIVNQGPGMIVGFANLNYAQAGQVVGLYVSTDQPSFRVTAYRMGWYGGTGGREIWQSGTIAGHVQPPCPVQHSTNMVSCASWTRSLGMPVTSGFVPGDYLLKLTGADNSQSYILLTVWQPDSHATYLVMNRSLVEQGWNTFGGYDYYQGEGPCILDDYGYPPCNRARVVSFDRPYAGDGSSDFLTNEYPLVEFMEQEGLDVTYCTDICISEHPGFLLQHRALLGLDHDETWTNSERVGALQAARAGVNIAFFGAATLVRHARLEPSPLGADRQEVDYRDATEDPLGEGRQWNATGNTWDAPPTNWDAETFLGESYSGYLEPGAPNAPIQVYDAGSWLFAGSGLHDGSQIPSAINSDIDHLSPGADTPQNLQVLAHSPIPLSDAYTNQGTWGGYTYSDVTYYTEPGSLAGVFDSGDNVWVATLQACGASSPQCPAPTMRVLTNNVLRLFGRGPAGRFDPSKANWQSVTPAGS